MRIWKFYLNTEKAAKALTKSKTIKEKYPLYAITNKKSIAKEFMDTRDMSLFVSSVTKDVDEEGWTRFANQNRLSLLEYRDLLTRNLDIDENIKDLSIRELTTTIKLLVTYGEYSEMEEIMDTGGSYLPMTGDVTIDEPRFPDPIVFSKDILEILRQFGYPSQYKLFIGVNLPYYRPLGEDDDYSMGAFGGDRQYAYDELSIFLKTYGSTFRLN